MASTMQKPPKVRMSLVDRAVSVFSPAAALRRYSSRVSLANLARLYDGAGGGRLNEGWSARKTSADAEIALAGPVLRDRMRDLVRNNPLAAQAVQVLVNNIAGTGIRPRPKSGNARRDKRVAALWDDWSRHSDRHGHTDFEGLLALAVREMVEGGEVFAVRRRLPSRSGRVVPLEIELFEADHLDESKVNLGGQGAEIRDGIEYDADGRRKAYYLMPDHPGGVHRFRSRAAEASRRVPAEDVAHLFERQRVQNRGVPWGVAAMTALRDHGDWQLAEMVRKKTEACLVGIVIGDDDAGSSGLNPIEDANGDLIESFRPGMMMYSRGGKDVKFSSPAHSGGVAEWNRVQMHIIAAGFRVPYALMTGDLSQANFSSNRAGLNEFRRMVEMIQWTVVIPMFCQRIWDWFCEAAFTAGLIDREDIPVEWAPPRFESVNPKQDAETALIEVRAGFATRSSEISRRGFDPREVEGEMAADNDRADTLGLILDSDPRRMSRAGQGQQEGSGSRPDDDEAGPSKGDGEEKD